MCLSASNIVLVCVCLVFAQIVRAKSCVNICVKNFAKRGLKTFTMSMAACRASEMARPGWTGAKRTENGRERDPQRGGLHLVVVGYLVASHICYLLQIYFEKFISIFIYFLCAVCVWAVWCVSVLCVVCCGLCAACVRLGLCFDYFWHYAIFGQLFCLW